MLNSNLFLLRNFSALQTNAMAVQKATPKSWVIYVTEKEYAYIKRRRDAGQQLYRRLLNRIVVLNSRLNLFQASA